MNKEEIKNEFITCIEGTHTINLAISVLEEREEYKQALLDIKEYIDYQWTWDGTGIDDIEDIVNKALEGGSNE